VGPISSIQSESNLVNNHVSQVPSLQFYCTIALTSLRANFHVGQAGKISAKRQKMNIDCLTRLSERRSRISSFIHFGRQPLDNPIGQDQTILRESIHGNTGILTRSLPVHRVHMEGQFQTWSPCTNQITIFLPGPLICSVH